MMLYFFCSSAMDLIGISLIGAYASMLSNKSQFLEFGNIKYEFQNNDNLIIIFSLLLIVVFILKFTISIFVNFKIIHFVELNLFDIRRRLILKILNSNYNNVVKHSSADYIQQIYSMTNQFANGILLSGLKAFSDLFIFITIIIYLFIFNPIAILLLSLILFIFLLSFSTIIRGKLVYYGNLNNVEGKNFINIIYEIILGFKEIRIFNLKENFLKKYEDCGKKLIATNSMSSGISLVPRYLIELILVVFVVSYALIILIIFKNNADIFAQLSIIAFAALRLLPSANGISYAISQYRLNTDSVNKIYESMIFQGVEFDRENYHPPTINQFNSIFLDNITFKYKDLEILKGISLSLNKGDLIGIVGSSGSGKSTLLNIMCGFLNPSSGSIYVNKRLTLLNNSEYEKKIAIVSQKSFMPIGSIINALTFKPDGHTAVELDRVYASLRMANLEKEIMMLEYGIETVLDEGGSNFSVGQIQRLAIARALYFQRELLFLDEPTSSLDQISEVEITESVKHLKGKVTTVIVSHKWETLKYCDSIYMLENGELKEIDRI
jgi:ATP-binding cassette subfamily C protein